MQLLGTYGGIVESNLDPEKLGRVKVRVPHVYGSTASGSGGTGTGFIGTNDLPWAMPSGMPAGGTKASGGFSHIPDIGDSVWVRFLDGEPEKPIYEWGMQTTPQRDAFKLHNYSQPIGTQKVGPPERAAWTRYGHTFEINDAGIIVTTSQGYQMVLTDASATGSQDGEIKIITQGGNFLKIEDFTKSGTVYMMEDWTFNIGGDWLTYADTASFNVVQDFEIVAFGAISAESIDGIDLKTSTNFSIDAVEEGQITATANLGITTAGILSIDFDTCFIGMGANEPFVLGNQLRAWIMSLLAWAATHVHTSSTPGSPTSPPTVTPFGVVQPEADQLLSESILGL